MNKMNVLTKVQYTNKKNNGLRQKNIIKIS